MRRSHSTEGRYCVRKELESPEAQAWNIECNAEGACGGQSTLNSGSTSRRNSSSNNINQLPPMAALKFDILKQRRKSNPKRRTSDGSLKSLVGKEKETPQKELQAKTKPEDLPNITIEIVDEDELK